MKIEELREIAKARTPGTWERPEYGDGPLSVWCEGSNIADTHQKRDFSMGSTSCDANTTAIVVMANHIDALLNVAEAGRAVTEYLNPMFVESDEVIINLREALKKLEEL